MTEQEIRQIVREELISLLAEYRTLEREYDSITDRYGNCYGTRKSYNTAQILDMLIKKLKLDNEA